MATPEVSRVSVKVPPFWKVNPALWFAQLEAQFANTNVTADETKFNLVVASVESEILGAVHDLILTPPATDKYPALKKRLIEFYAESESSKIRTLLQGLELGDQRPSYLLTRMRGLAGSLISDDLLKSMWLSRLPTNVQAILATSQESLQQLAVMADKICECVATPQLHAVASQSSLETQIAELSRQLQDLASVVNSRRPRDRGGYGQRNRSRSRSRRQYKEPANGFCFYHTNFGANAKKPCNGPCSFNNSEN